MSLTLKMKALVEAAAFDGFGETTPVRKMRKWRTDVVQYDSMVRQSQQVWDEPLRYWYVNWTVLDAAARAKIIEIFDAARGQFETFLWLDDDEYLCENEQIATDGTSTEYQLQCTYYPGESYEWTETKIDIVDGSIYPPVVTHSVDGAQTEVESSPGANEFTLDDTTGILTFGAAPSSGILTVTFEYYFRVAFAEDSWESVLQYPTPIYQGNELQLIEVK